MTLRIGYTLPHTGSALEEPGAALDEAVAAGVDTVEVALYALDLVVGGAIREATVARLGREITARGLGATVHGHIAINLMAPPEEAARHEAMARLNIAAAAALGARRLVIHCGTATPGTLPEARARQISALARLADAAAAEGLLLCVETTTVDPGEATLRPTDLAADLRAAAHPALAATLDFAHVALESARTGTDAMAEAAAILPVAPHLHLNDCFARPARRGAMLPAEALAYGMGDLHLPIGWGNLDWAGFAALPGWRGDAVLNLELHARHWEALGESLGRMRALARQVEAAREAAAPVLP